MPSTSAPGARTACERFKKLMTIEHRTYDRVSFAMFVFIGMATWSVDRSVSSNGLTQNAAQALEYARANRITHAVSFSEIKK
jgi:GGDEF domain-containing protein